MFRFVRFRGSGGHRMTTGNDDEGAERSDEGDPAVPDVPDRLLDAAGPIFARDGFEGATVRDICGAAGANVASVAYYFGDKMGLYRAVIRRVRDARERQYPVPRLSDDPERQLFGLIQTLLSRMLSCDEASWQSQLMMREMHAPTAVFRELVDDYFRPLFRHLTGTIASLVGDETPTHRVEQLALSVVGQCLYYRVGAGVLNVLIPDDQRAKYYDPESLSRHITAVTLSAAGDLRRGDADSAFRAWGDPGAADHTGFSSLARSNSDG